MTERNVLNAKNKHTLVSALEKFGKVEVAKQTSSQLADYFTNELGFTVSKGNIIGACSILDYETSMQLARKGTTTDTETLTRIEEKLDRLIEMLTK